jgi:hypothetical protein
MRATTRKTPDQVTVQKILHNNVCRNNKRSKVASDSNLDGSGFSEISDGDTFRVEYILITRNKKIYFR